MRQKIAAQKFILFVVKIANMQEYIDESVAMSDSDDAWTSNDYNV